MNTVNSLGTPPAAYAPAPQQAGFAPPAAVDLPPPADIPRESGESGGEPPPDLLNRPARHPGASADDEHPAIAGAAYGADGQPSALRQAGARLNLLAF